MSMDDVRYVCADEYIYFFFLFLCAYYMTEQVIPYGPKQTEQDKTELTNLIAVAM